MDISAAAMAATMALLAGAGKTAVPMERAVPGFIGDCLQLALWREAIVLVERGICDAAAEFGPLENADLVGTGLTRDIHTTVLADLEVRRGPSPLLQEMVAEGRLAMKSGEGFRRWAPDEAKALREKVVSHLLALDRILAG